MKDRIKEVLPLIVIAIIVWLVGSVDFGEHTATRPDAHEPVPGWKRGPTLVDLVQQTGQPIEEVVDLETLTAEERIRCGLDFPPDRRLP